MSAVIAALHSLGAKRIAMITPYVASVTGPMRAYLAEHDIETVSEQSYGEQNDRRVARISEASTREAALRAVAEVPDVDAVFMSCTNLQTFGILESLEAELGIPVISSNSALIWHLLHIAGMPAKGWGPGRLYALGA